MTSIPIGCIIDLQDKETETNKNKEEIKMKKFTIYTYGKKVELEILGKVSETKLKINVTIDEEEIAKNETATICQVNNKPNKLYLNFNDTYLTIADTSRKGDQEHNRRIADWIWESIQDKDDSSIVYAFTTHHWQNWEE